MSTKTGNQPATPARQKAIVVGVYKVPATSPSRLGEVDTMVFYRVGNSSIMQVKIPKQNPTSQEIQAAIKADWAANKDIVGSTVEL